MKFEESEYYNVLNPTKLVMPFGSYYLCEKFLIAELDEGVHFDWDKAELIIKKIVDFYEDNTKIGFISNRINHYSVNPSNWLKVEEKYNLIEASAIVMYNNSTYMNASIEKQFSKTSMKRCLSLQEAIEWMRNLKEFN